MKKIIMAVLMLGVTGGVYAAEFGDLAMKARELKASSMALPDAVPHRFGENKLIYSRIGCEVAQPAGAVATITNEGGMKLWFWGVKYTLTNTDNATITKEFTPMKRIPVIPGARVSIPLFGGERATGCEIENIGLYEDGQSHTQWPIESTTPSTATPQQQSYITTCVIKGNNAIGTIYSHAGSFGILSGTAYFRYYDSRGSELDKHSTHVSLILTTQWDSENIKDSRVPNGAEACALEVRMDQK